MNEERTFTEILSYIEERINQEWRELDEFSKSMMLEKQKRAILGFEEETGFYKEKIKVYLEEANLINCSFPGWYLSLVDAVFSEMYGLAGIAPWAYDEEEKYKDSQSLKVIGDRIYCLIEGKSCLQPQTISKKRREQLKRSLLMSAPRERIEKGFHEVYLKNGIRVTIFSGERTKENEDIMVFRKYVLRDLSLEKMAELKTIPYDSIELFKLMIKIGFNVLFVGPVRSGKTTFLQAWQRLEDPSLEGLAISTDPETDWKELMPNAPVMQLVCDGNELETVTKSILRGDNDYIILEEMRDEVAFKTTLEVASFGARRCKATAHTKDPVNLPYQIASRIRSRYGGELKGIIVQFYNSFNYAFEFFQTEEDRSRKKLKAVYEYCYSSTKDEISVHKIMEYDPKSDEWRWNNHIGDSQMNLGMNYPEELLSMMEILEKNANARPIAGETAFYPKY